VTGGIALAAALTVLPGFLPYYLPPPAMAAEGAALRVASLNVLSSNRGFDAALREVRALNPDIVFFMEVNGAWNARLAALKDAWPYALECPEEDNFGVLLLSRIPWKAAEIRSWSGLGVPSVEARFDLQGRNLTLYGIHPVPPSGGAWTRHRDRQLARVAEAARSREGSVIVLGDFNTTPWAPSFGRFLEASGLRDAALGFGIGTTWRNPLGFIRLPIDHICVSRDIAVRDYRIGGDIGSDHFPVCADLVLRP
jgi:endonuclease/exonuclease/phosphatase (EEP) superfamily protein YafD